MTRLFLHLLAACAWLLVGLFSIAAPALASDIGVSPVAVHLGKANDRASVSVVNNGSAPVVMQAEVVEWRRDAAPGAEDGRTLDMMVNPAVFTMAPGQTQVVRVGMRKAAQASEEGTYRIVLREVPMPPRPGEVLIAGQVRVLMALRVPVYVAPVNMVRDNRWQATREADGSVVASVQNTGNVHVRVGRLRLRAADADPTAAPNADQAVAEVVFPGEGKTFRLPATALASARAGQRMLLEIATDQGPLEVPVTLARQ